MSNGLVIYCDTTDYQVYIGVSPFVALAEGQKEVPSAYLIVNKTNGQVEGEHRVVGMAIRMAKEMQDLLDAEKREEKAQEADLDNIPDVDESGNATGDVH